MGAVDEPGRLPEPARQHGLDDRRRGSGSGGRLGQASPDLDLQLPHRDRSDEVGRQLGRAQPRPVPLVARLGLLLEAAVDHQPDRLVLGHRPAERFAGVDPDVDDRVRHRAQVELPVGQHERRVVGAVADVHHHLGHVDRPALGEDAAPEHRSDDRRVAVRIGALEVVAGHGLVDREQPQHPVVVLAEVALGLLGRPVLGDRRDREERLLALVERTGRIEHRAAERAQEDRRPADLERVVGEADELALAAERLDPGELGAAPVEEVLGPAGCSAAIASSTAADERRRRPPAPSRPGSRPATARRPAGPSPPGRPTYSRSARSRTRAGVSSASLSVWRSFAVNSAPAEPAFALGPRQDHVAEMRLELAPAPTLPVAAATSRRARIAATAGSVGRGRGPRGPRRRPARPRRRAG